MRPRSVDVEQRLARGTGRAPHRPAVDRGAHVLSAAMNHAGLEPAVADTVELRPVSAEPEPDRFPPPGDDALPDRFPPPGDDAAWAAPGAGWVPPGSFGAQVRALLGARLPAPVRHGQWNPGRRGALALGALGLIGVLFATVLLVRGRAHPVSIPAPGPVPSLLALSPLPTSLASTAGSVVASVPAAAGVVADVEGKVARPGLEQLASGARVADALRAAGGTLAGANTTSLDLARLIVDGEQLRVDLPGAALPGPVSGATSGAGRSGSAANGAGISGSSTVGPPVNLNSATESELDALPGVGPVTAQRIIDWRTQHGQFTSVEQLQEVTGIGPSTYAKLAKLVTV